MSGWSCSQKSVVRDRNLTKRIEVEQLPKEFTPNDLLIWVRKMLPRIISANKRFKRLEEPQE